MKTKRRALWLVAAVFAVAGFALTAEAGWHSRAGKTGRTTDISRLKKYVREPMAGSTAPAKPDGSRPLIASIKTNPEGQSYGRWAAEWWQWAVGVPADVNPVLDATGEHCGQRQVDDVWFLAGSFSSEPVVRSCEVPAGKSLFFPLINIFYGAFLNDPPETRTDEFVRAAGSCTQTAQISVQIDGFNVPKPTRFFTGESGSLSPLFNLQLPPGNVIGVDETVVPELVLSPSAEQGYYLFVRPLSPGTHILRWVSSGCTSGNSQDVTYHLTVLADEPHD